MFDSRWSKVLKDLAGNKTRSLLIVLSIAVGLFAVGTIISSYSTLSVEMGRGYAEIIPSSGTVRTVELFDEGFISSVRSMPGVADVEARRVLNVRVRTGSGEWVNLIVFSVGDYSAMRVNRIFPVQGAWPPPKREILIERNALALLELEIGDELLLETAGEKQRVLRIAGTAHDMAQIPAQFDNSPYGYVSFDTLEWFGEPYGYNELDVVVDRPDDKIYAQQVINQVKTKAEKNGFTIPLSMAAEPGQLPTEDILQAVLFLMASLGVLSLFLSAFLIINTITALLAQQRRQIGVMKAIGASTLQILSMYLGMVVVYGLAALALAIPASILGSRLLNQMMASMFNFDLGVMQLHAATIWVQVGVGLLIPILASLVPFLSNLRISAAEAISSFQIARGRFGASLLDRLLSGQNLWFGRKFLPRSIVLSMRNIFRSKARLALTLSTLSLASAIFISVFSVQDSLMATVDDLMKVYNFETFIMFRRPYLVDEIIQEGRRTPGVADVDIWLQVPARRVRPDGSEGKTLYLFAPRAESEIVVGPAIVAGRWLLPGDQNALIVDAIFLKDEPDLKLGDTIVLKINGRDKPFRIVGFSMGVLVPVAYANYEYISQLTGYLGKADVALVSTAHKDPASIASTNQELEQHYNRLGMRVGNVFTTSGERAEAESAFQAVTTLLMIMAILLAIVGGLGLMGTMSINILEQTREIGVLRAIGAPGRSVSQVFILEGVAIGILSWGTGALLALPLGRLLSDAVGMPIMGVPLQYDYSMNGLWVWLILVIILSAFSSYLPARGATRLTVREILAYE